MAQERLTEDRLCAVIAGLVADAEKYRNDRSADREKAMAFYDGDDKELQKYIPADEGRSRVVSRDVRAAVRKIIPSIRRTILGGDQIVEYQPVGEGDEETAEQATDYINSIVLKECNGRRAIKDAVVDALKLRNGVLKWWQNEKIEVRVSRHSGLDEMAFAQLVSDDEVEVLEHSERMEQIETPEGVVESPVHDLRIKRRLTKSMPRLEAIEPENFLIDSDAVEFEEAVLLGENFRLTRSDLVAMGYDRAVVDKLPAAGAGSSEQEAEENQRRRDVERRDDAETKAMEEIEYYDLLVRVDYDDDGIAELRRMVFAGGLKAQHLLENTEWDEVNYASIVCERRPHQWEGNSIPDEVMEVQRVKTVLLRQTLDNLYWQNNLQPIVQEGQIVNPESVLRPAFGSPIRVSQGVDVRTAVGYNQVPMVADKSFAMLEYMDQEASDRTGVNEASSGLAPDALQNMTAKASAMIEQAGIGQTEEMVGEIAISLKPVFRGLLKLVIQHQDKPRTVRLRKKWVTFDPRQWNAEMDAEVSVGLGAGTRERDTMAIMQVLGLQERILASMGPAIGTMFVTPDNIYNTLAKLLQAIGIKTVDLYFTKPDTDAIKKTMEAQSNQPSPEEIKAKAAMELEQVRGQVKMAIEAGKTQAKVAEFRAKAEADAQKEGAQLQADLATELQRIEAEAAARMEEAILRAQSDSAKIDADLTKAAMDQETEFAWMAHDARQNDLNRESDAQQAVLTEHSKERDRQMKPDKRA